MGVSRPQSPLPQGRAPRPLQRATGSTVARCSVDSSDSDLARARRYIDKQAVRRECLSYFAGRCS